MESIMEYDKGNLLCTRTIETQKDKQGKNEVQGNFKKNM